MIQLSRANGRRRIMAELASLAMPISLLGLACNGANGQEIQANGSDDQEKRLEDVSVSATGNPVAAFDYPGQVTVIDREAINDLQTSTIQDVFDSVPGVQFDSGPRRTGDTISIRGLDSDSVLILLDGVRQNFRSGHDGVFFVDPELVQSLEIVRGPASALYGSGALGGVVATRTITAAQALAADQTFQGRVSGGYHGVNSEWRGGATALWRSQDIGLDVVAHATYRDSGNIRLGNGNTLASDDAVVSSLVKGTFRKGRGVEADVSWMRYRNDATDTQNPQGINVPTARNAQVARDVENNTIQGSLKWRPDKSSLLDARAKVYFARNLVGEDETQSPRFTERTVTTVGVTADNRSRFTFGQGVRATLSYGGEYYQDDQIGVDSATSDRTRGGVPNATARVFGGFAQADIRINAPGVFPGKIIAIPGVRWDSFSSSASDGSFDNGQSRFSPRIAAAYKPISQFLLFANYSEGFRAPNINEAFADGVHFVLPPPVGPNLFVGDPNLKPEISRTLEGGAGIDLRGLIRQNDALTVKASVYGSDIENLIGFTVTVRPNDSFSRYLNFPGVRIEGVEVSFSYESDLAYLGGYYASITGRDTSSDGMYSLASTLFPNIFYADAGVKLKRFGLRLGARGTLAAEYNVANDPLQQRDAYAAYDLYAVWKPSFANLDGVRVNVGVDNVLDTDYEVVAAGVSQPGRNFKIAFSWSQNF